MEAHRVVLHRRIRRREELERDTDGCGAHAAPAPPCWPACAAAATRTRGEDVLAVGLHGSDLLALQPGIAQQAAQAGERMLDDAVARGVERVVALEEPQPAAGQQSRARAAQQPRQARGAAAGLIEHDPCKRAAATIEVRITENLRGGRLDDSAGNAAALREGARPLRRPPRRRQRRATLPHNAPRTASSSGCRTPISSSCARRARPRDIREPAARPASARAAIRHATADGGSRQCPRCAAVLQQHRVGAVEQAQQAAHEARRRGRAADAVVHPLPLAHPLDQARVAEDLQVARSARLALLQCPGEFRNTQRAFRAQRQQAQPAGVTGGTQPVGEDRGGKRLIQLLYISLIVSSRLNYRLTESSPWTTNIGGQSADKLAHIVSL